MKIKRRRSGGSQQGQDDTRDHTGDSDIAGAITNLSGGEARNPPSPPKQNDTANHGNPAPWFRKQENWHFIVQMLLLVVGVYVAKIYSCQLSQMIESNRINRDALQSVQRAYLSLEAIGQEVSTEYISSGERNVFHFNAHIENTGNTPAVIIDQDIAGGILSGGSNRGTLSMTPTEAQFIGMIHNPIQRVLGPHVSFISRSETVPTTFFGLDNVRADLHTPMRMQPSTFSLWGWIAYRDVFHATDTHLTEFCVIVNNIVANKPPFPIRFSAEFIDCQEHNCADEQCKDYSEVLKRATTQQ